MKKQNSPDDLTNMNCSLEELIYLETILRQELEHKNSSMSLSDPLPCLMRRVLNNLTDKTEDPRWFKEFEYFFTGLNFDDFIKFKKQLKSLDN